LWSRRSGVRVPSLTLKKALQIARFMLSTWITTEALGSNWGPITGENSAPLRPAAETVRSAPRSQAATASRTVSGRCPRPSDRTERALGPAVAGSDPVSPIDFRFAAGGCPGPHEASRFGSGSGIQGFKATVGGLPWNARRECRPPTNRTRRTDMTAHARLVSEATSRAVRRPRAIPTCDLAPVDS
jgi:hypothetical protein